jgi:hypothetical protein
VALKTNSGVHHKFEQAWGQNWSGSSAKWMRTATKRQPAGEKSNYGSQHEDEQVGRVVANGEPPRKLTQNTDQQGAQCL